MILRTCGKCMTDLIPALFSQIYLLSEANRYILGY